MKFKVSNKFIFFPVSSCAVNKNVSFFLENECVYSLNIALDAINPNFYAKVDVSRFIGKELELKIEPFVKVDTIFSDTDIREANKNEPLRPLVHFTPKFGWMNDPNGLIKYEDEYHMFFQHNPCSTEWENMHWGHAVSKDLVNWEERDVAVFPDKLGVAFSGSAIIDDKNLLGLKQSEKPVVLLYYTSVGPACQSIAYSADGLNTFEKLADNPVIPHIVACNRDPKVVYCEELGKYVVALYLKEEEYLLLTSSNLKDWKELQHINLLGDAECPDFFPIYDNENNRKWVFIGAHDKYMVGDIKGGKFVPVQPIQSLHYGVSSYAGQTFSGLDNRCVRINWLRWNGITAKDFRCCMSFPTDISLVKEDGIYYLSAKPVSEIKKLYKKTDSFSNVKLTKENGFKYSLDDAAYHIQMSGAFENSAKLVISYFGRNIEIIFAENEIIANKNSGPISLGEKSFELEMIIDRSSLELYADGGKIYCGNATASNVCDRNLPIFSVTSDSDYQIDELKIIKLEKE